MFNKTSIETAASGLVGYAHSYHPFYSRLATAKKSSSSGYYVNALPGVTFDVIESTIRDEVKNVDLIVDDYYEIRTVGGGNFTNVGAASNTAGVVFKATGTTPTAWGTGELKLVSCNGYAGTIYNQELLHLVSSFVDKCKDKLNTKEILSNQSVIKGVNTMTEKVTASGRFVGFLLNPVAMANVKSKITYLGMQLDGAKDITIYLYETSKNTAVKTHAFTLSAGNTIEWEAVTDWFIEYSSTTGGTGQQYIMGYYEDDLGSVSAYKRDFDDNSRGESFRVWGKYLGIAPIAIPSDALNGTSLPDNDTLDQYITEEMHGLYFKFNTTCDITNVLVDNISVFAKPLQYAIAIRILEDAVRSGSDGIQNPTKNAMFGKWKEYADTLKGQLYGGFDSGGVFHKGLVHHLAMDFSNLDKICLKKRDVELLVKWVV